MMKTLIIFLVSFFVILVLPLLIFKESWLDHFFPNSQWTSLIGFSFVIIAFILILAKTKR